MQYWRLSAVYLCYFAALGALWPYWGLYLKSIGFTEHDIGLLIALIMATKIVAPYVWGVIADRHGRRMIIVRLASLLAALAFAGVYLGHAFWWLALVLMVYSFFWNAALPQFEATTLLHLGRDSHRYSQVRLWGSVGFIVSVLALGPVLEHYGPGLIPTIYLLLLLAIWLASLLVSEPAVQNHAATGHGSLLAVIRQPVVIALFIVCFLVQASHGPYYTFYSIYLQDHGYGYATIGWLWATGVVAEIGVFMVMHRLLPRLGSYWLLIGALLLASVRWLVIAWLVESPLAMFLAQTLHAASFAVYHAVAISLIHRYFAGRYQGRGQALYSSISFGAGGAAGSYLSGVLWAGHGGVMAFSVAALLSTLAAVAAVWGLRATRRSQQLT